jgi:hypothetical protein
MPETRIDSASASDLTNAMTDYSVAPQTTDGATQSGETEWINEKWSQYLGYYKSIPELRAVIDAKATWTVGKGFEADADTTLVLDQIKGLGNDSFNTILENLIRTMQIGGDAFAEIVRGDDGDIINLKPLDPSSIKIVANNKGLIIRYEKITKPNKTGVPIAPEKMLHLMRNRVADEIHGVSMIESLEWIILAKNAVQESMRIIMQRNIKPVMIFHLDSDDPTEISAFKTKMDNTFSKGENIYVPKDVIVPEVLSVAQNATLNPMPWLEYLVAQFYQTAGVPQIILGGSGEFTEASAKIAYLAYEQTINEDQLYIEEQMGLQMGVTIKLTFPATLENELLSDTKKDKETGATQPNDTTAGVGQ